MLSHLQTYLLKRTSKQEKVSLTNKNIYILPTKQGFFYAFILLLMLLTAINFSNSLIFLLTFFLASLGLVSMLFTQKSLLGLSFQTAIAQPVYCKQNSLIPLYFSLANTSTNDKEILPSCFIISYDNVKQTIDIFEQKEAIILSIKTTQRGYVNMPPITVSSTFPFGLFYAWSNIKLTTKSLVYPQPIPSKINIKSNQSNNLQGENSPKKGIDDFFGLDKYITGQSLKHIHWKAYAKEQGLYIKTFSSGEYADKYWFDISLFKPQISVEKRLSYLCYFINQAAKNNDYYGLKLNQKVVPINHGDKHKQQCLALLALQIT